MRRVLLRYNYAFTGYRLAAHVPLTGAIAAALGLTPLPAFATTPRSQVFTASNSVAMNREPVNAKKAPLVTDTTRVRP